MPHHTPVQTKALQNFSSDANFVPYSQICAPILPGLDEIYWRPEQLIRWPRKGWQPTKTTRPLSTPHPSSQVIWSYSNKNLANSDPYMTRSPTKWLWHGEPRLKQNVTASPKNGMLSAGRKWIPVPALSPGRQHSHTPATWRTLMLECPDERHLQRPLSTSEGQCLTHRPITWHASRTSWLQHQRHRMSGPG